VLWFFRIETGIDVTACSDWLSAVPHVNASPSSVPTKIVTPLANVRSVGVDLHIMPTSIINYRL